MQRLQDDVRHLDAEQNQNQGEHHADEGGIDESFKQAEDAGAWRGADDGRRTTVCGIARRTSIAHRTVHDRTSRANRVAASRFVDRLAQPYAVRPEQRLVDDRHQRHVNRAVLRPKCHNQRNADESGVAENKRRLKYMATRTFEPQQFGDQPEHQDEQRVHHGGQQHHAPVRGKLRAVRTIDGVRKHKHGDEHVEQQRAHAVQRRLTVESKPHTSIPDHQHDQKSD